MLLTVPVTLIGIEFAYFSSIHNLATYQVFPKLEMPTGSKPEVVTLVTFSLVLLTGIILQAKIEIDNIAYQDEGCLTCLKTCLIVNDNRGDNGQQQSPYKLGALRTFLFLGLVFVLYSIIAGRIGGVENIRNINLIQHFIGVALCPSSFVLKHESMKKLAWNLLKSLFMVT